MFSYSKYHTNNNNPKTHHFMIRLLLFMVLTTCTAAFAQQDVAMASCCEATPVIAAKEFGRCSGDEYCTACKNCSACKHCSKEGGSCGVCTTYSKPKPKAKPKARAKSKSTIKKKTVATTARAQSVPSTYPLKAEKIAVQPKERTKPYKDHEMLEVIAPNTTLRGGEDFTVIEPLAVGQMLTYISISNDGQWLEVRVDKTGSNGFVFKQFVK